MNNVSCMYKAYNNYDNNMSITAIRSMYTQTRHCNIMNIINAQLLHFVAEG